MEWQAMLTVKDAAEMTTRERNDIAEWLREQAHKLVTEGENYDDRYRAKYGYPVQLEEDDE